MSRASFLSPPHLHRLDWACRPIYIAYGTPPYLVGSVEKRPDFRDIDLRLILPDDQYAAMVPTEGIGLLLNIALSDLIGASPSQSDGDADGTAAGGMTRLPLSEKGSSDGR